MMKDEMKLRAMHRCWYLSIKDCEVLRYFEKAAQKRKFVEQKCWMLEKERESAKEPLQMQ
jgi:hypothetical protein